MFIHLTKGVNLIKPFLQALILSFLRLTVYMGHDSWRAHEVLGRFYARRKQWQKALTCFEKALKRPHHRSFSIYHDLANALLKLNQLENAISAAQQGIALKPDFCWSYHLLGDAFLRKNEYAKAAIAFQKFVDLNPSFSWAHHGLGLALFKQNLFEESVTPFKRAIELNPDFRWSYQDLGNALTMAGRYAEAIPFFQGASRIQMKETKPYYSWPQHSKALQKPKFFITGQTKCGTSSLYHYLAQHPNILPPITKEIHFFSEKFRYGMDWYLSHFPQIEDDSPYFTGEASASYLDSEYAPERISQFLLEAKLIILLRNPVDRAYSDYNMRIVQRTEQRAWNQAVDDEMKLLTPFTKPVINTITPSKNLNYLSCGIYDYSIKNWLKFFDRRQFLILESEDFYINTKKVLGKVFDFLGVRHIDLPEYEPKNVGSYSQLETKQRKILSDFFRPHNRRLQELLDQNFNWDN